MEYFIKASAVLGIFYICYKIFLQRETFFNANRWFLLVGLIVATFLPLLVIPIYVEYTPITIPENLITTNQIDNLPNNTISLIQILSYIYVAGLLFFLGKMLIEFTSLFSLIKNNEPKKEARFTFIEIKNNIPPFSFFNWIVYNPSHFQKEELTLILNHEKVHAKQYHSLDVLLAQFCCVVFWFNPLCWFYKKELQQNLEYIADLNAQDISNCEQSYQRLLLKTSITNHPLVVTNNFYNSLIKKRIVMLHKSKSNKLNAWKFTLVLPLLGLFLMSFNTKEVYINTSKSDINNASENIFTNNFSEIEIVLITKDFSDAELEKVKNQLLKEGLTIKFKGIKRNASGEILAIKIDISSNETSANYHINGDEPINPIKISFNKDGNHISIGSASIGTNKHKMAFITEDGNVHKIETDGDTENVFVFSSGDNETEEEIEIESTIDLDKLSTEDKVYFLSSEDTNQVEVVVKDENGNLIKNGDKIFISTSKPSDKKNNPFYTKPKTKHIITKKKIKDGKIIKEEIIIDDENTFVWQSDDNEDDKQEVKIINLSEEDIILNSNNEDINVPLFILDGKEITKEDMEKVSPENIASVNVWKGDKAVEKYGEKAKDGVVEITTKK
jgi:beta-lactamase regulating signal transducer with metallopeptidase domain